MSHPVLDEELWNAVLGPYPQSHLEGPAALDRASWPPEGDGPVNGVFMLRWVEVEICARGATTEVAKALHDQLRRELRSGALRAVAIYPDTGRAHPIPQDAWQATGEASRVRWWSGQHRIGFEDGVRCDVYLFEATGAAAPEVEPPSEMGARERNQVAKLVYGLMLFVYGDPDRHGIPTEVSRDLERRGIVISDDTVRKWRDLGREQYDPETDSTRKT